MKAFIYRRASVVLIEAYLFTELLLERAELDLRRLILLAHLRRRSHCLVHLRAKKKKKALLLQV